MGIPLPLLIPRHQFLTNPPVANQHDADNPFPSKLKLLVPSIGQFFTRLPLEAAFKLQDRKRYISSRRFVSPSFNDVRLILNSAQMMGVTTYGTLQLATFDGDVTLYDDGQSLEPSSPIIPRLIGQSPPSHSLYSPHASNIPQTSSAKTSKLASSPPPATPP